MSNETDLLTQSGDTLRDSLAGLVETTVEYLPNIILALVLLLIGLFIAGLLKTVTHKILEFLKFNKLTESVGLSKAMQNTRVDEMLINFIPQAVYWAILLIFIVAIANTLGLEEVSSVINDAIAYIPNIIVAVIIFVLTLAGAQFVKQTISSALNSTNFGQYSGYIGMIIQGIIILFGSMLALAQLGLNVELINDNITVIVQGIVAALALAFGLGGRTLAHNVLSGLYSRQSIKAGDVVSYQGTQATVISMNDLGVVVKTKEGQMLVPYKELV